MQPTWIDRCVSHASGSLLVAAPDHTSKLEIVLRAFGAGEGAALWLPGAAVRG